MIGLLQRRVSRKVVSSSRGPVSWHCLLLVGLAALCPLAEAQTIDVEQLDQISVSMPRTEVRALLGEPDEVSALDPGLIAEVYRLGDLGDTLVAQGVLYDASGTLVGHALVFDGALATTLTELLVERGYRGSGGLQNEGRRQLSGYDDDTGRAQIVDIVEDPSHTVLTTFERRFYADHAQ